jgi:DNA adenine methylase
LIEEVRVRSIASLESEREARPAERPALQPVAEPSSAEKPRPFLKWAGGKTRLLSRLLPYVPDAIGNYFEPFLGGGAMFFALQGRLEGRSYLSDLNDDLINAWVVVRDSPAELLEALADLRGHDCEAFYYQVRAAEPAEDGVSRAARFVYFNQTAWNGLWRVNRKGEFNVPWGSRPFRGLSARRLLGLRGALARTEIDTRDFRSGLTSAEAGDFVYLDPPYLPVSDTSKFFFYTEQRFRAPDLRDLAAVCEELTARTVAWVLSNRDTPLVRELFGWADVVALTARRSVAAQNRRDVEPVASPEVIVVGPRQ